MAGDIAAIQCGVCGVLLNYLDGKPIHAGDLSGEIDHPTVPVPFNPQTARYKCDICAEVNDDVTTAHTLPANDFDDPVVPNAHCRGGWALCPTCSSHVKADDWPALAERAYEGLGESSKKYERELRAWIKLLHARLRENITGPIQPYQPGDESWDG